MQFFLFHRTTCHLYCANTTRLTNNAFLRFKSWGECKPHSKRWQMFIQAEVQLKWNYSCWNTHLANQTLQQTHPFTVRNTESSYPHSGDSQGKGEEAVWINPISLPLPPSPTRSIFSCVHIQVCVFRTADWHICSQERISELLETSELKDSRIVNTRPRYVARNELKGTSKNVRMTSTQALVGYLKRARKTSIYLNVILSDLTRLTKTTSILKTVQKKNTLRNKKNSLHFEEKGSWVVLQVC